MAEVMASGVTERKNQNERHETEVKHKRAPSTPPDAVGKRGGVGDGKKHRVRERNTAIEHSGEEDKIHRRVAVGKSVRSHSIPQKEKVPKWGLHKNLRQASPRAFREKRQVTVFRLWTPFAESLLRMFPMTFRGSTVHLRRLGTAGIAPFQCATRLY